ncbi:putative oligopeptide transporter OPT family [Firmicutes bacterium CAG:194]|nr:putative oligopeptide transporter OPT family [Firmicutes bacterium CAG:194]
MNEKETFKPYISADRTLHEMTPLSIIVGIILAIVFGAANAYLGLRVGMTVSASIPAAGLCMGVYRPCRKKDSWYGCLPPVQKKGHYSGKQHGTDDRFGR